MPHIITIDKKLDGLTIKQFFKHHYPHLSYPLLQTWLRKGEVKLNGKKTTGGSIIALGDRLKLPPSHFTKTPSKKIIPINHDEAIEKLHAITLFENHHYCIINKPEGLAVQGGTAIKRSLDDWLFAINQNNKTTPYKLVHRLDRYTSGVMILAKGTLSAKNLTAAFQQHTIEKTYLAVVRLADKALPPSIHLPLKQASKKNAEKMATTDNNDPDGLSATSLINIIAQKNQLALLALKPISGRKHQLRVHLAHLGVPIIGDKKYGHQSILPADFPKTAQHHLLLHAYRIILPKQQSHYAVPPDYFPLRYFIKDNLTDKFFENFAKICHKKPI
ncbi:MAG: RluA family pseudouridine synthase [Alphaproteobacteria bacterium]